MFKRILWSFGLLSVMVLAASGWKTEATAGAAKAVRAAEECPVDACDPSDCPLPCESDCTPAAAASCPAPCAS